MMYKISPFFLFFFFNFIVYGQENASFSFVDAHQKKEKISFISWKNLIILSVKLNDQPMNFLLDTGVGKTIVFGDKNQQEYQKINNKKILIKGVSGTKNTFAYKISHNKLELGNLMDKSHEVYVVFDPDFYISNKIGYPIHGIIGYDFFKYLIVNINYLKKNL